VLYHLPFSFHQHLTWRLLVMAKAEKKPVELPMIDGTQSSKSYAVFARKGKVVLSIKPNAIMDGTSWGAPGTTYIGMRLRSAPKPASVELKGDDNNVASFSDHQELGFSEAWPEVTFEKDDPGWRASTQIGVFLRGNAKEDPQLLLDQLENKKFATKAADYLIQLAGGEKNLVVSRRELINWFQEHYTPLFGNVAKAFEMQKKVSEEIEKTVGVFGMQAALMKKLQNTTVQESAEDIDPEDGDNDNPDDDPYGNED
jgi:hypothetical protein